jgi:hypothetical protein
MRRPFILVAFCLAMTSATLAQNARPVSPQTHGLHPIASTEARRILTVISTADADSDSETDCSHLVHDVYEQAGFPYDYVSSRELYDGSANFTRVRAPQAGDLIVWRGHVGIVLDPKEHVFFSSVRSGPETQFYDSPYWRSRGVARFFRYVTEKPLHSERTLQATLHAEGQPPQAASPSSENHPPSKSPKQPPALTSNSASPVNTSRSATVETSREIVLQVAGKNPSPEEVAAAFVEMNQGSGESLRPPSLNRLGKPIVVYRDVRVSAVQIRGKRGTALVQVELLGAFPSAEPPSEPRWKERTLDFEKTKRGWVISPIQESAYVSREVALRVLSARLAEIAQDTSAIPEQKREQKEIIRFLNLLVANDSRGASAQSN